MNALNTALQQTQTTAKETILSLPHQLKAQLPLSAKTGSTNCRAASNHSKYFRWQRSSFDGGDRSMFNSRSHFCA